MVRVELLLRRLWVGCPVEVRGDSNVKLSLVWRPLEVLANDLGFRIKLVIRDYLPGRVILDEVFIWRFECFHLKELLDFIVCFIT